MDVSDLVRLIHSATAPLKQRLGMMVSRIVIDAVNDGTLLQSLRVTALADEVLDRVEHMQPGGLTHHAMPGAEGVLVCPGGYRDHPIALAVSNRAARPRGGAPGETALWSSTPGTGGLKIRLLADGDIEMTPTAGVRIVGNLDVTGLVTALAGTPGAVGVTTHGTPSPMGPLPPPMPGT